MPPVIYTAPFRLGFMARLAACLRILLFGRVDVQHLIERDAAGVALFKESVIFFGGVPGGVPETDAELAALPAEA